MPWLEGKGDGTSAKELKDDRGEPISPTDLTLKPFKSGPNPEDLYRTISTGLNGTPMPSYADVLTPEDRWSLVSYILSIATKERPRGMMGFVGEEVRGMSIRHESGDGGNDGRKRHDGPWRRNDGSEHAWQNERHDGPIGLKQGKHYEKEVYVCVDCGRHNMRAQMQE